MNIVTWTDSAFQHIKSNIELIANNSKTFDEFAQNLAIFVKKIKWQLSENQFIDISLKAWDYFDYLKNSNNSNNLNNSNNNGFAKYIRK